MKNLILKYMVSLFMVIYSGLSYANNNALHDYAAIKAEADKVIKTCGYDDMKTYKLYVATLDSLTTITGSSRDDLNAHIKKLLKTNDVGGCVSISTLSDVIVGHYKQTLNSNIP